MGLKTLKPRLQDSASSPDRRRGRWLLRFRDRHFAANPLCVMCERKGRVSLATQLDHIVALTNGGQDFDKDPSQAQGLCAECHEDKTRQDLGQRVKKRIGPDGWPID